MQQPPGPDAAAPAVPNTAQMSREAKHMRVMLMLCVKEKVFDQNILESIFSQYLQCEQTSENAEEAESAFRRIVGRTYGPRSKEYLNAIDRAKVKLEQLKERKNKGELNGGNPAGPNVVPSSFPIHPQSLTHPMSSNTVGGPPMLHHPQQQYYNNPPVGPPRPAIGGQALPHIQPQPILSTQVAYKTQVQHIGGQSQVSMQQHTQQQLHLPVSQQHPMGLPHSQPAPMINPQQMMYDNRTSNYPNPSAPIGAPNQPPSSQSVANDPQKYSYSSTPVMDLDDIKQEDAKKKGAKKKGDDNDKLDDGKKKKPVDNKKGKGAPPTAEVRLSMPIGGIPIQELKPTPGYPGNVSDELDNITEKPNLMQEGLQTTDKGIMTGYIVDGMMLSREEQHSRHMMREHISTGMGGSSTNMTHYDSTDSLGLLGSSLEVEPFMENNIVGKDILETVTRKALANQMELGSTARKLLSDGIQSHLKTILEGAIEISRKRLNRSAYGNYQELFQLLKQNQGEIHPKHLSNVGLKWGPDIHQILSEEENRLNQFYRDYQEIDEKKLIEKMKHFDEERARIVGTKRKFGLSSSGMELDMPLNWWERDVSLEDEGLLSYEQIAEIWKKNDIASKHELGPFMKKKSQKKVEGPVSGAPVATTDGSEVNKLNLLGQNSSISVEQTTIEEDEEIWMKDQSCPITFPSQSFVMPEDVQQIISKRNGFMGTQFDRDTVRKSKFQWKLLTR